MERSSVVREGIIAGIIGATVVAVWFLLVDMVAGRPLYTPELLGRGLLGIFGRERAGIVTSSGDSAVLVVAVYTVIHYVMFMLVGIVVAAIVRAGEREPGLLAGALILFVAMELGFYGLSAVLAESPLLGALAWYQIGIANLLAAAAMGTFLWRRHPRLGRQLDYALGGGEGSARSRDIN